MFDAVYQIRRNELGHTNLTQIILDYHNEQSISHFTEKQVVLLCTPNEANDMRLMFGADYKKHGFSSQAPLIIKVNHARLQSANQNNFEACFQILTALLITASCVESGSDI